MDTKTSSYIFWLKYILLSVQICYQGNEKVNSNFCKVLNTKLYSALFCKIMNLCKIFYLIISIGYCWLIYSGSLLISQDTFTYARFFFLVALLLHLQCFELVPGNLTRPPLYPLYKVGTAIILANIILLSVFIHLEDLLTSILSLVSKIIQDYAPDGVKEKVPDELILALRPLIMTGTSLYYLLWVISSVSPKMCDIKPSESNLSSVYSYQSFNLKTKLLNTK